MSVSAIVGGAVWTGGESAIADGVVVVEDTVITAVGSREAVDVPPEATVIDASGATILPGLIDVHVHMSTNSDQSHVVSEADYLAWAPAGVKLLHAMRHGQRSLASGFTTLRAIGLPDGGELHLKEFSEKGLIPLPRIALAPWWITMTGGHGDMFYPPHFERREWFTADGEVGVRESVRKQLSLGADFIKIMASGGALSHGDKPEWPNYTRAEIAACTDEAHDYDLPVAAHAHSIEGIRRSLDAGVDSIEHGTFLDEEQAQRMAEMGTFLVPTMEIGDHTLCMLDGHGDADVAADADKIAKLRAGAASRAEAFAFARSAGVKIAMGTDSASAFAPFGNHARELELYVEHGMTPVEALRTATSVAAELLRRPDLGVLEPGATADIVCVDGDPLADIHVLRKTGAIRTVMKEGRVVSLTEEQLYPERVAG